MRAAQATDLGNHSSAKRADVCFKSRLQRSDRLAII